VLKRPIIEEAEEYCDHCLGGAQPGD